MDYTQNKKTSWFIRFTQWRERHISAKNFTLILAVLVGLCSAFAALTLKNLIHFIQHFLTENFSVDGANYLYLLYPVVGIFLAGLFIRYIVRDDIGHGVTKILYAISRKRLVYDHIICALRSLPVLLLSGSEALWVPRLLLS